MSFATRATFVVRSVVLTHRGHSRGELRVLVLHQRLHRGCQEDGCPGDDPATWWLVGAAVGWGNVWEMYGKSRNLGEIYTQISEPWCWKM